MDVEKNGRHMVPILFYMEVYFLIEKYLTLSKV